MLHRPGFWLPPLIAALMLAGAARAEPAPDSDNGRYTFSTTADGVLRLDTRSGEVSSCSHKPDGWACYAVPDERAALDAEIGRLVAENARLKAALAGPGGTQQPGAQSRNRIEIPLPSDADVTRAMSFLERVWRQLIDMAGRVHKDIAERI